MMFADSWFWVTPVLIYLVLVVVITVLAYLVLRFGIRDGLRAHARWVDKQKGSAAPAAARDAPRGD